VTLIGIEEHWTFEGIDRALRAQPPKSFDDSLALNDHGDAAGRLADVGPMRVAAMDEQGLDLQVLSLAPPGTQGLATADATALSRDANDAVIALVSENPIRFRAMATLPLADPAAAAVELNRVAGLGLTGAMVYGRTGDVTLDDPRFEDLWTVAAELGQPIFIHPQIPPRGIRDAAYRGLGEFADLALATFSWGWHLEAGTAALRLMASGVLDRQPNLRLILGHWGELLLFWHQRADGLARAAHLDRSITEYLQQNVWITASGMLDPAMLKHALSITTPGRIMFSTDYPFQQPTRHEIDAFLAGFPDDAARIAFSSGNAEELFQLRS
jgi:predicted TIM-barrel fold metal-dependent hydrolase